MKPRGRRVNKMFFTSLSQLTHQDCSAALCPCSTLQREREREREGKSEQGRDKTTRQRRTRRRGRRRTEGTIKTGAKTKKKTEMSEMKVRRLKCNATVTFWLLSKLHTERNDSNSFFHTFTFNVIHHVIDQTYDRHYGGWSTRRRRGEKRRVSVSI